MTAEQAIALIIGSIIGAIVLWFLIANQKSKIKEGLLWAVTQAEKELGGGTGQLKLRQVYDWFTSKFPVVSSIIPFKVFSAWVDTSLETMRGMLGENAAVTNYVLGGDKI